LKTHPLAKRYARALFELAEQAGQINAIAGELKTFTALLEEQPRIKAFIMSQDVEKKRKLEVLEDLLKDKATPLIYQFLTVLVEKGRQNYYAEIVFEYNRFQDQKDGRVHAQVISAVPLQKEQLERVRQQLADNLKAEIILDHMVDASILGGVIIRVEGKVIDGSLRKQVERLRRELHGSKSTATA